MRCQAGSWGTLSSVTARDAPTRDDDGTERWSSDDDGRATGPSGEPHEPQLGQVDASNYEFDDVVGRGGVGVVIRARDRRLRRKVAVKLVLGRDATAQARFEREALLTARLQHPGIVPIYEAGRWPNGESFYAMRLVEGQPLAELVAATATLDERLALLPKVVAVTEAVAYAHTERVIHRDLKPRNVVVGAHGEVMVVDWGLAKDLGEAGATDAGAVDPDAPPSTPGETVVGSVMGTPAFMPPEQARGERVDERADVYALGALLYNVLTGAAPFGGNSSAELLRRVQTTAPEPVEVRQPGVPRDLAAIVTKAMEREPDDRYANAGELAADLKRFVTGQLVGAHHYSRPVLIARAIRRHPVVAAIAVFAVALGLVGALAFRRIVAEQRATEARSRQLLLGQARALLDSDPTAAVALLQRYPAPAGAEAEAVRAIALDAESRGVARHVLAGHTGFVRDVAFSPDGTKVASASSDGQLYVWDLATGAATQVRKESSVVDAVEFDPRGRYLAASVTSRHAVLLHDLQANTARELLLGGDESYAVAFAPDGVHVAVGTTGGHLFVFDVATGDRRELVGHAAWISTVAYSPDGTRILTASEDGTARLWTVATGEARAMTFTDQVYVAEFSEDGAWAIAGCIDGTVRVYSVADAGAPPKEFPGNGKAVDYVGISPDGTTLAWSGMSETIHLADLATGAVRALHGHTDDVTGMVFLPDGTLLSAGADGTVRRWHLATGLADVMRGHEDRIVALAIGPGGRVIASGSADRTIRVWPLPAAAKAFVVRARKETEFRTAPALRFLYSEQEGEIFTALDLTTGALRTLPTARPWVRSAGNPTGTQYVYRDPQRRMTVVDVATGKETDLAPEVALVGRNLDYSPDGSTIAFPGWNGLYVVDAATLAVRELLSPAGRVGPDEQKVVRMLYDTDGKKVLTVGRELTVWDLTTGTGRVVPLPPDITWPCLVLGSPGFGVLAAAGVGGLSLYDGTAWRRLHATDRELYPAAFSPDGAQLVAADEDGRLSLWRVSGGERVAELSGHVGPVRSIAFSADGRRLATGGSDGALRVWDLGTRQELAVIRAHGGRAVEWVTFRGDELLTAGRDGVVRVWPPLARAPGPVAPLLRALTGP
jgi:WD40 repeat protein/tRNA A-37 threonylcarbamoyl transferase component Bud32